MTQPIAGWYPDPAGDTAKLRYWDGTKWTDSMMDADAATQAPQPGTQAQPQPQASTLEASQQPYTQTVGDPNIPQAPVPPTQQASAQAQQPDYSQAYYSPNAPLYYVSPQDETLRLIAFILALISTIASSWAVIPLAWMIPMTVMTWGIYKGKRPNTVAFGVCSLIFLNVIGGILLLVSTKDE